MSVSMSAKMDGGHEVMATLLGLSKGGAKRAFVAALNDAGHLGRKVMQEEMRQVFSNPTPHILRSPRFKGATASDLSIVIHPTYLGGRGVDPQQILQAQEWGGTRVDKRSEVALKRAGILPRGYQTVIPSEQWGGPYPGSADEYGNIKGSFIRHLLAYFQTFGEQGSKANMLDKTKARVHRGTAKTAGRRYFVAHGAMRGGARMTAKGEPDRRASTLRAGIWAVSGTGGVDVRPVLMFVKAGRYKPRLSMERVSQKADLYNYLQRRVRYQFRKAAGV